MHFNWDRISGKAITSLAVLGLSTALYAAPDKQQVKQQVGCKPDNFAFAYPKDLNLCHPLDFYTSIEGLIFQGMETGTSFTMVDKVASTPILDATVGGFSGDDSSWDYNPGMRLALGVYVNCDAWALDFSWLWLNMTNHANFSGSGTGTAIPLWLPDAGTTFTSNASAGGNLQCTMNVLDAALGKPYHVSRKVILKPHFGLRFAWIDQHLDLDYGGTTRMFVDTTNDFFGVGARVGVDSDWILGKGFKLYSNLSSSVLAGGFNLIEYIPGVNVTLKDDFQMVVPNLELALGLDWGCYLNQNKYYLDFRFGYEFQVWWDQWNMRQFLTGVTDGNFINVRTPGNLTLNGFTLKIQLDM